jgi:hypothetical protein
LDLKFGIGGTKSKKRNVSVRKKNGAKRRKSDWIVNAPAGNHVRRLRAGQLTMDWSTVYPELLNPFIKRQNRKIYQRRLG